MGRGQQVPGASCPGRGVCCLMFLRVDAVLWAMMAQADFSPAPFTRCFPFAGRPGVRLIRVLAVTLQESLNIGIVKQTTYFSSD